MVTLVELPWVEQRLDKPDVLVLDPRTRMRYLQGHLKGAINLPRAQLFDAEGRLLPVEELVKTLGSLGLGDQTTPLVYDSYDGQNGAILCWLLEYLGCNNVHLMGVFWERWVEEGREVLYRQVMPRPKAFTPLLRSNVRATAEELLSDRRATLLDLRSAEEYTGERDTDGRPGHIPGAVNLVWRDLIGRKGQWLASHDDLDRLLSSSGVEKRDVLVTYCRLGTRAAVGYVILQQLGYDVRLYDGSYAEWVRLGLPTER